MKRPRTSEVLIVAGLLLSLYATAASTVYRFRHPEMTETQLFLHTVDWMLWRK